MVAPAPAIGSAGPPAAGIVIDIVIPPGVMLVVLVMGAEGGAALPARPLAIGAIVTGALPLRPATSDAAPAVAAPSGGVASVPA